MCVYVYVCVCVWVGTKSLDREVSFHVINMRVCACVCTFIPVSTLIHVYAWICVCTHARTSRFQLLVRILLCALEI